MFLEGRPPVNVGVTSSGDVFGGTAVTLRRRARRQAVQLLRRVHLAVPHVLAVLRQPRPSASSTPCRATRRRSSTTASSAACSTTRRTRRSSAATRRSRDAARRGGGTAFGIYPLDRYHRIEVSGGFVHLEPVLQRPGAAGLLEPVPGLAHRRPAARAERPAHAARRRVRSRDDGLPRVRAAGGQHDAPRVRTLARRSAASLSRQTLDADVRHYLRLGTTGVLATRFRGFRSRGDFPDFLYFGGNADLRGYDYLQFVGQNVILANAELRFPIIEAALTPIGVIGGIRGVFFAGIGGAWFSDQQSQNPCAKENDNFRFLTNSSQICQVDHGRTRRTRSATSSPCRIQPCRGTSKPVANYIATAGRRLPPAGRPRVVRHRARDVRARLPDPLRLVVADADQPGLGERRLLVHERPAQRRVRQRRGRLPQAALRGLDRLRLLIWKDRCQ